MCRARHAYDAYGDGDMYRAANQRMVISAIGKKILQLDPVSMATVVAKLSGSVTTDMDVNSIIGLATSLRGLNTSTDIYHGMEPTTSKYVNQTWYEICNTAEWKKMMQRVDQGLSPTRVRTITPLRVWPASQAALAIAPVAAALQTTVPRTTRAALQQVKLSILARCMSLTPLV